MRLIALVISFLNSSLIEITLCKAVGQLGGFKGYYVQQKTSDISNIIEFYVPDQL